MYGAKSGVVLKPLVENLVAILFTDNDNNQQPKPVENREDITAPNDTHNIDYNEQQQ